MDDRTIVLVEDQTTAMRLITWILMERGYRVSPASTAEDGLEQCVLAEPCLVICNTKLGQAGKRRIFEVLRRVAPGVRIIDVHDHAPPPCAGGGEADALLHKPFDADDLLAVVDALLSGFGPMKVNARAGRLRHHPRHP